MKNNFSFRSPRALRYHTDVIFYVASKTKHAPMWRALRERGVRINSSWIDEAGMGKTKNFSDLASRCIEEATQADGVILYAEPEDTLKGALLECGAALAAGRPVVMVGRDAPISRVFDKHPLWYCAPSIDEAFQMVCHARQSLTTVGA